MHECENYEVGCNPDGWAPRNIDWYVFFWTTFDRAKIQELTVWQGRGSFSD